MIPCAAIDRLVSVVIPCWNQGRFLPEAIQSVLSQSHDPKEIIVVDDGSTDDTAAVASSYGVRYIYQRNAGLAAARNRGIRESTGAFLVFLDADDRLLPGALNSGLACLHDHPDCAFVFGGFRHIALDGSPLRMSFIPKEPGLYLTLLHYNHIGCPAAVMYRRGIFELAGGFEAAFNPVEDYELYLRIARRFPIRRHPQVVAEYRKYDASLSDDPARMLRSILRVQRSQRRHIGSCEDFLQALAEGTKGNRAHYLGLLRIQAKGTGTTPFPWRRRLRLGSALLWWDAKGFVKAFAPNLYCTAFRWSDAIRNRLIRLLAPGVGSTGMIGATPNPIRTGTPHWDGPASTSVTWQTDGTPAVEIHVDQPDGPLFSTCSPNGCASTGDWVRDGTRFYLQAVSGGRGESARTLAVVTVNIVPE